ncbi:MAG: cobalamin-binding protein [Myxococcales bacterium]|nr:cobalamin-binding protein [Myxococcales bacterium]
MTEPQRIVTLLPSATEICFALGLGERVIGVSHECDFPPAARALPVLTAPKVDPHAPSDEIDRQVRALVADGLSVYRIDEERLRALAPDLIVTQDACEVCAVSFAEVQEAARRMLGEGAQVVSLAPLTVDDVLEDIRRVGRAAGVASVAEALVSGLRARLESLRAETASLPRPRTIVLEWLAPPMIAGHWTPELIRIAGGDPILGHDGRPTGPIPWERVVEASPEALLVIPCGFPLAQSRAEMAALAARPGFADLPAVRAGRVVLLDGNAYFNRPGPRLVESAELAALALHPDHFAGRFPHAEGALERWSSHA